MTWARGEDTITRLLTGENPEHELVNVNPVFADAVRDQFNGTSGMPAFGNLHRMRRTRHGTEYPTFSTPAITARDAADLVGDAREIVQAARKLFDSGKLTPFEE